MALDRPKPFGRFSPDRLFLPASVAVVGARTDAGAQVVANLVAGGFKGAIMPVDPAAGLIGDRCVYPDVASLPQIPDLAVVASEPAGIIPALRALADANCFAAVVTGTAPDLRRDRLPAGMRVLGPGSFGISVPHIGLNASRAHLPVPAGRLALVSQSAALCRAVLDWAAPNGVGFSHIVGIGGNLNIGFGLVVDWLSRDPGTGTILLDIRTIRDARAFLSAARAAARLRPVVAIRAGGLLVDRSGAADLAFEAALRRAGILSVLRLEDMLAAIETLARSRPLRSDRLAIVTNAIGPGRFAADAALRDGVTLASLAPATETALRAILPDFPLTPQGFVHVPPDRPLLLAQIVARLAPAAEVGGILVVHAPVGAADKQGIEALANQAAGLAVPVLVAALGETTGAAHRARLAAAGVPVFASPEQAARGFHHLVQHRRSRDAATELPPSRVLAMEPDRGLVNAVLADIAAADQPDPTGSQLSTVLAAYGLRYARDQPAAPMIARFAVMYWDDAMFGPVIGIGPEAGQEGGQHAAVRAIDLPPLNLPLAQALVARAVMSGQTAYDPPMLAALAECLVRVSQLVIDAPRIAVLRLGVVCDTGCVIVVDGALRVRSAGDAPATFAIAPYPAELAARWQGGGETVLVRPIRPEDAEQHGAFFQRLAPEDIRFRFFSAMRALSAAQMARMTQVDYDREMAFIASREASGETVGVARLVIDPDRRSGEFAVIVQRGMKGKGLASHLMRRLIDWGSAGGLSTIVGQILADNAPMLAFVRHLGFVLRRVPDEPDVIEATLSLGAPTDGSSLAGQRRDHDGDKPEHQV
jgi:acetyltransferase